MFDSKWNPTDKLLDLRNHVETYDGETFADMTAERLEYVDLVLSVESAFMPFYRQTR